MFFQKLYDISDGVAIKIEVMRKNDKLTLNVIPQAGASLQSIAITGTPEELEDGFFDIITAPVEKIKGLQVAVQEVETKPQPAAAKPAAKPEVQSSSKHEKDSKKPVKKEIAVKKEEPKKAEKVEAPKPTQPQPASLF